MGRNHSDSYAMCSEFGHATMNVKFARLEPHLMELSGSRPDVKTPPNGILQKILKLYAVFSEFRAELVSRL